MREILINRCEFIELDTLTLFKTTPGLTDFSID